MPSELSVLLVEDDAHFARTCLRFLNNHGISAHMAVDYDTACRALSSSRFDMLITDITLGDASGLDLLPLALGRVTTRLVMSGSGTIALAVEAMRRGAADFIEKPFDEERFVRFVMAHAPQPDDAPVEDLEQWRMRFAPDLLGSAPQTLKFLSLLKNVATSDSNVLLLGESGTGKEVAARALHASSGRGRGPFVPVNCAAIPDALVESELFGHAKGAFTGANRAREGHFLAASGGTIFLDEVGEASPILQAKLLRVLQDREVTPLGENQSRRCDVRVVSATNRVLPQMVEEGRFREDLFFRLNVIPVRIPALRDRKEDLPELVSGFTARANARTGRKVEGVSNDALALLTQHDWPGNARELENTIERLVVHAAKKTIQLSHLEEIGFEARQIMATPGEDQPLDLKMLVDRYEARVIQTALARTSGNQSRAASLLKINRSTLLDKLRRSAARVDPEAST